MASISAPIPTSSLSFTPFQKLTITAHGSPVLRLPSMRRFGGVRCSMEGKPAVTSDDGAKLLRPEGKHSWPELVGVKGEVAAAIIEKENPQVKAIIVSEDSAITGDLNYNRVWVVVNSEGVVIRTPESG